jgi:aldehyde:ferredoxin oxidoreductase
LPTKNFSLGQFEGHEKISGETMYDVIQERDGKPKHGCHAGCVIQCSQIYNDANKKYKTSGFEYETIWAVGADCCVDNLDHIAEADHLMDDIGVDSIEIPVALGVAMEAGVLEFGDGEGVCRILREEIAKGTGLGRIIGAGTAAVGKAFGVTRVPVVKNQGIPAYDPRAIKGIGITYATSTMGADHTMGYAIASNLLNVGGSVDPLSNEGQVELSRNLQIATAAIDSTGMCLFIAFAALDDETCLPALVDLINARFGISLTGDDVVSLGKSILKTEKGFNEAAGFTNADDRLPEFFSTEPLPPHNVVWDMPGEEIDRFWDF